MIESALLLLTLDMTLAFWLGLGLGQLTCSELRVGRALT
jgi:hypothetical protein